MDIRNCKWLENLTCVCVYFFMGFSKQAVIEVELVREIQFRLGLIWHDSINYLVVIYVVN